MSRNYGLPRRPETPSGEVCASLVFAAFMAAAGTGLLFGALYVQHTLRAWGFHV